MEGTSSSMLSNAIWDIAKYFSPEEFEILVTANNDLPEADRIKLAGQHTCMLRDAKATYPHMNLNMPMTYTFFELFPPNGRPFGNDDDIARIKALSVVRKEMSKTGPTRAILNRLKMMIEGLWSLPYPKGSTISQGEKSSDPPVEIALTPEQEEMISGLPEERREAARERIIHPPSTQVEDDLAQILMTTEPNTLLVDDEGAPLVLNADGKVVRVQDLPLADPRNPQFEAVARIRAARAEGGAEANRTAPAGTQPRRSAPVRREDVGAALRIARAERNVTTTRDAPNVRASLAALWSLEEPAKYSHVPTNLVLKMYPFTPVGVYMAMKDNTADGTMLKEVVFFIILVKLLEAGLLEVNSEAPIAVPEPGEIEKSSVIDQRKLTKYAPAAKSMIIVAVHAFAQGGQGETVSWFESYSAVKGDVLTAGRFTLLVKIICGSERFHEVFGLITVGDLRSESKVLQYRLTRYSSPALIMRAVRAMMVDEILGFWDAEILKKYRDFHEAGIIPQFVGGPCGVFLKGDIDAMAGEKIPNDTLLVNLSPVIDLPYDEKTIKRAYIILKLIDYNLHKWYQGERAMSSKDGDDILFQAVAAAVYAKMGKVAVKFLPEELTYTNQPDYEEVGKHLDVYDAVKGWAAPY